MLCAKYNLQSERTFETPCISSLLQVYYDSLFYYKVRRFYYKVRRLLQSTTCIYSSKQSFSSNQVNDQLFYSLLHYRKVQPVTLYKLTSR